MACRLTNLVPPCGYNPSGIAEVGLLDFDDFGGLGFVGGNYASAMVESIYKGSPVAPVPAAESSRYSGTSQALRHEHRLETFAPTLAAGVTAQLNAGLRRRFVVLFKTHAGTYHLFGAQFGATLTYTALTDDGVGAQLSFVEQTTYPLFEVEVGAFGADDWVLRTGAWDMGGTWYLDEIWKTI